MWQTIVAMLVSGAPAAPAPVLAGDAYGAAMQCGTATTMADTGSKSMIELTAQLTYYVMRAHQAKPSPTPFFTRVNELVAESGKARLDPATARALAPHCARRFPRPAVTPPARLPRDAFARDVTCLGVFSLVQGATQDLDKKNGTQLTVKVDAVLKPVSARLTDAALAERGYKNTAQFLELLGLRLLDSIELGDPLAVARACGLEGI